MKRVSLVEQTASFLARQIMEGTWGVGDVLPGERELSEQLQVTRPTLREALIRLSGEGWLTIAHGKPTRVNAWMEEGQFSALSRAVQLPQAMPREWLMDLLNFRKMLLPGLAMEMKPGAMKQWQVIFERHPLDLEEAKVWAEFDWSWQSGLVHATGNRFAMMVFSNLAPLFSLFAERYFVHEATRLASARFYQELALTSYEAVPELLRLGMEQAVSLWLSVELQS